MVSSSSSRQQHRLALQRKLHILRTITCSNSVKKSSIIKDALLYIYLLKLKLEAIERELSTVAAIKREYFNLMQQLLHLPELQKKEVKVEKAGKGFMIRVSCHKKGDNLVQILEVFEEMRLTVLHARVSCTGFFSMEAIVISDDKDEDGVDIEDINQALLQAIN